MTEQVCAECDYFAGQTENMTMNQDKQLHQEIDHDNQKIKWVDFYQRTGNTKQTECQTGHGKGVVLDNDGEDMGCPNCDQTGVKS